MRIQYLAPFVLALLGVMLGAIAYFGPSGNTGVDGTPGALLALIGAAAATMGAAIAMLVAVGHRWLLTLNILILLAAALTALAAYFLMQTFFAIAMAGAVVGLVFAWTYRTGRRAA